MMNEELDTAVGSRYTNEIKPILIDSLIGTVGVMWVVGGFVAILSLYGIHWALGWSGAFVWVWGCWGAALYFDVRRFFH